MLNGSLTVFRRIEDLATRSPFSHPSSPFFTVSVLYEGSITIGTDLYMASAETNKNSQVMPRAKKKLILSQPVSSGGNAIKVKLDHRTTITLKSLAALDSWKQRYPQAQVIR